MNGNLTFNEVYRFLWFVFLVSYVFKKSLPDPREQKYSVYTSRSFIGLDFKSVIHLKIIFMCTVREGLRFIFIPRGYPDVPVVEKSPLLIELGWDLYRKLTDHVSVDLFLQFLFHFIDQFVFQYVSITLSRLLSLYRRSF